MLVIADAAEGSDVVVTAVEDRRERVSLFLFEFVADDGNGDERPEMNRRRTERYQIQRPWVPPP